MLQSIAALGLSELQVCVSLHGRDVERRNSDALENRSQIDTSRSLEWGMSNIATPCSRAWREITELEMERRRDVRRLLCHQPVIQ
jgi:hypothetical protein